MYGLVNRCIELLVTRNFGDAIWEEIKRVAGLRIQGSFSIYQRYDDSTSYDLVGAAEKVLSVPATKILELFGEFFYAYCVESGYSDILKSLSSTPSGFLESLDALHDHLGSTYVGMRAPSFRCTREDGEAGVNSRFYLHYYSHRAGLAHVVIGIVRAVCWDLFKIKAELKIADKQHLEDGEVCILVEMVTAETDKAQEVHNVVEQQHKFPQIPRMSPATFSHLFPFHIMFNRKLQVVQMGTVIARLIPDLGPGGFILNDIFDIQRPRLPFTFSSILGHINTVYVLNEIYPPAGRESLRLKGQMILQYQEDLILFVASPSVLKIQKLFNQKLHLSDIPVHDSTKNLVVMSEHFSEEYELSHQLEVLTNTLQLRYRDVEIEKQKTEKLVYAAFPPSIVEDVKKGRQIPARQYKAVTVLFTGILDFQNFCVTHEPIDIVNLLNDCYTEFDSVLDPEGAQKVYKVETIADHYMCVSGCPEERPDHARAIVELAIRLMHATGRVPCREGRKLKITVGIHTGEIVAGIIGIAMPRFCLFGDTVNTTSRTESFGKKGFINLTQYTFDQLQFDGLGNSDFNFTFYDKVAMKGKLVPLSLWLVDSFSAPTNKATSTKKVVPVVQITKAMHTMTYPLPVSMEIIELRTENGSINEASPISLEDIKIDVVIQPFIQPPDLTRISKKRNRTISKRRLNVAPLAKFNRGFDITDEFSTRFCCSQ